MPFDPAEILLTIAKNIANLFPARVVQKNEQGVRWTLGKPSKNLYAGKIHYFWPAIGHIDKVDITDGTIDIDMLTVDVEDKTISLDGAIRYAVTNARRYLLNLEENDAAPTLSLIARGCVSDIVREYGGLEEKLYGDIVKKFNYETRQYGVKGKQFIPGNVTTNPINIRLLQ